MPNREKWLWYLPWKDLPPEAVGGLGERIHEWLANHHVDHWGFEGQIRRHRSSPSFTARAGTTVSCGRWICSRACESPAPPSRRAAING